ncbi:MAG: glycosyltransferase family 4 protein [Bacteroidota bacterium]
MISILFIHQSAELYGSDKTLLSLVKGIDKKRFRAVVILPFDGPLKHELEKNGIKVVIAPVLKLYRKIFTPKNILRFFKDIRKAFTIVDELNKEFKFEFLYSNTLAVLLGIFYARKSKIKHLWHVHEIIESPGIFSKLFRYLLGLKLNTKIIYNSLATKVFWEVNTKISSRSLLIHNGLTVAGTPLSKAEIAEVRKELFNAGASEIIIALVGRISRWKGQQILLNCFNALAKTHQNVKLVFVGSPPPNQEFFLSELQDRIEHLKLSDRVVLIPFTAEIEKIWQSIDIAIVPSTEPEPFGLVALEAMLAHKPVIGSNHGGLTEIIVNEQTGFLVEPNNENQLCAAIQKLVDSEALRNEFGEKGYKHALTEFSEKKYINSFEELFEKMV